MSALHKKFVWVHRVDVALAIGMLRRWRPELVLRVEPDDPDEYLRFAYEVATDEDDPQ